MAILAKICLCGDGEVGKTSLKDKYLKRSFQTDYIPTIGSDFVFKKVIIETNSESREIGFQIWDLAGQPAFDQVRAHYFRGVAGAFLVFDITRPETLNNLGRWMEELSVHSGTLNIPVIVLGNKIDLQDESMNTFDSSKAIKFIEEQLTTKFSNIQNRISYYETSAKTGKNVEISFQDLGRRLLRKFNNKI